MVKYCSFFCLAAVLSGFGIKEEISRDSYGRKIYMIYPVPEDTSIVLTQFWEYPEPMYNYYSVQEALKRGNDIIYHTYTSCESNDTTYSESFEKNHISSHIKFKKRPSGRTLTIDTYTDIIISYYSDGNLKELRTTNANTHRIYSLEWDERHQYKMQGEYTKRSEVDTVYFKSDLGLDDQYAIRVHDFFDKSGTWKKIDSNGVVIDSIVYKTPEKPQHQK